MGLNDTSPGVGQSVSKADRTGKVPVGRAPVKIEAGFFANHRADVHAD